MGRLGPKVRVEFSCWGCEYLRTIKTEDGDGMPKEWTQYQKCAEPSLMKKHFNVEQVIGRNPSSPAWCPFRDRDLL